MFKLKVSDNSWHYNLAFKSFVCEMFDSAYWKITKSNLCPYMRHIGKVLGMLFLVAWFVSTIPFHIHDAYVYEPRFMTSGILGDLPILWGIWFMVGGLVNWIVFVIGGIVGVVAGCVWVFAKVGDRIPEKFKGPKKSDRDPDAPDSTWTLVKAWFTAHHDKVCPEMEIVSSK